MSAPSKQDLVNDLNSTFADLVLWLDSQPEDNFNKELVKDKWTTAGHLYHLIKSTKGVSKGLSMPKMVLRMTFGVSNREERTFDQQYEKYIRTLDQVLQSTGKQATPSNDFVPEKGRIFDKQELIKRFDHEKTAYLKAFEKISENDLGKFVLPHPLMGKLTLREFTYFTIFHTRHHLDNLKENYT